MQCKICIHQQVCMHKQEFDRLEGALPITLPPFKSSVECSCFVKEAPQPRTYSLEEQLRQQTGTPRTGL
jgi:hypothetical protein